ncbi:MAG: S9 family peptidase [Cyclobacteriaceae bacterium]|nr:S9 family peptidase [Cyclobacteriaceae bacterium]
MRNSFLLIVLCFSVVVHSEAQNVKKLRLEQSLDMETVADPQLSPDGSEIVYARTWIDKLNDKRETDLWIMSTNGSKNRFLIKGGSPSWSPDGTRIAYTASGDPKGTQIFVKYKGTEGSTQITRLEKSPSNITWSPDGQQIAFTMIVPAKNPWPVKIPGKPEGAKWTEEPKFINNLVYRRDRVGFLEEGYVHIFTVPAGGGTPRQVTQGDWDHGTSGISWTRDGKEIVFSSLRIPEAEYAYRESEIYAVNVATGVVRQLTTRKGPDFAPVVSPDGKLVAYVGYDWTDDTYRDSQLYVMNIDGTGHRSLTATLDRSPGGLIWAADNSGVYFNAQNEGSSNFYFAPVKGNVRQVTQGKQMLAVNSLTAQGIAVGTLADSKNPGDVASFTIANPKPVRLTNVNEDVLGTVQLGDVEEIWYTSVDDYKIQGWIVKPPDFDPKKRYPLILVIHGGPHAMYNLAFNFTWQHHAAEGYVVLYTNPRGSTGYGSAFANAIKNAYPDKDYDDLMKGVDEVIKRGYIDDRNLFVYGGSGGGVLTSWIVGHTDRFAAASVNFPVTNWLSFVGTTDGVSWYKNFAKYPWEDPSEHLKRSSLMYVGNVKTPTMLMCGVNDLRTPISQTEEYYSALKVLKVPTVMIRFNEEFHGTSSKPSNYLRTQQYLYYWFNQYKRNGPTASK